MRPPRTPVTFAFALVAAAALALSAAAGAPDGEFTGERVVHWTGRALGLKVSERKAGYYTADEFAFTLESPKQGRWQVVSREPTPFETWRMGPTYTRQAVDWSAGPRVRLTGVKGVDRIPPTYPGLKLDPARTVTALILEVESGGAWRPWYVNNWFHKWSTPAEDRRIAAEYVGRGAPYAVYGFRDDAPAPLTAASRAVAERHPTWRCYHGALVRDATVPGGIALEVRHLFAKSPRTGGYECVHGDPQGLVPLNRPPGIAAAPATPGGPPPAAEPERPSPTPRVTRTPPPQRPTGGAAPAGPGPAGGAGPRVIRDPPPTRDGVAAPAPGVPPAPAAPAGPPGAAPSLPVLAALGGAPGAGVGGWWMFGGGPEHTGQAATLPPPLQLLWEAKGGKEFAGGPAAVGSRVYIGNNDGKLYCFDAATGRAVWTFAARGEIEATPTVWNGLVLVGSFDGHVYAVDAGTGKERWRFATGPRLPGFKGIEEVKQGVDSSIAVVKGKAYFGAWDGKAYCLDAETGKQVWAHQLGGIVHWHSPAVSGGKVLIGATDGKLYCLNADTGAPIWTTQLCGANLDHMMGGAAIAGNSAYLGGGYENGVYAVSLLDGKIRWTFKAANLFCGTPAVDGAHVYGLADGGGQVFALERATGKPVWTRNFGKGWGACLPVLSGTVLYVTMREGTENGKPVALVALDAANGRTLWSHAVGPAWSGPAVAGGRLFYGSDDGKLRAFGR